MTLLKKWPIRLRRTAVNALYSVIVWLGHFGLGGPSARQTAMWLGSMARERAVYGDWYNAIRLSSMAVKVDPGCAEAYLMLGYAYMRAGDVARAREVLGQGSRLDPTIPHFAAYVGEMESSLEHWAEAEAAYRQALELESSQADWLLNLALTVKAQKRWEEARALLEKAREVDPSHVRVLVELGFVRFHLGDLFGSKEVLTEAIEREPTFALAHYYLSMTLAAMENWEESLAEAHKAVQLRPEDAVYREYLGQLELHAAEADFPEAQ